MAPESWAIAHPERSAMLLAPRDELAAVDNSEQLTHLVAEYERLGLISKEDSELIISSLAEPQNPVGDLQAPAALITSVDAAADADTIPATAAEHDRNRLLVRDGTAVIGSVQARRADRPRGGKGP